MNLQEYNQELFDEAHKAAAGGSLGAQLQESEPPAKNSDESDPHHPHGPHPFFKSPSTIPTTVSKSVIRAQGTLNLTVLMNLSMVFLQEIGKTRFGTYWLAYTALDLCFLFIRNLVIYQVIKFKVSDCSLPDRQALLQ